ncbi:EpsG family protein [Facklamia miroungae]|uniref:EpsG family protein n=1 Tax=Facklamia miroungae TaxID=120956 RepID=A0A1G7PHZ0_9LACT|nr:EpsG family protein [Facklamia miroungae]NKZ28717.1 hypothetical protein [Facklamia miroungae]SDF85883.1 EpsG family protein [Facklamia miroungae]
MTYVVYALLFILNLLFGIKRFFLPNNFFRARRSIFLMILSYIGCFLLIAGYRNFSGLSSDLVNNEHEYMNLITYDTSIYEPGYVLLMKAGSIFSLDFYSWRNLIIGIALLMIFIPIFKFSKNPHFVLSFFSSYLIIVSAEQFRNFIGFCVLTYGLIYYLYSDQKYKRTKFIVITIIAGTIHSLFYIYLVLVLIDKTFSLKTIHRIIFLVLVFCVFIFINNNSIPGLNILLNILGDSRATIYLSQHTRFGFAFPMLFHLINTLLSYLAFKKSKDKSNHVNIYKANLITMIFFPLYMLQTTFSRISRNLLIINYMTQGDYIVEGRPSANKLGYVLISLIGLFIWFYFSLFYLTNPEAVFKPFFEDNIFLSI